MTPEEKKKLELLKQEQYPEALRYVANAKDILAKSGEIEDNHYPDAKYVRIACGTAYNGVLLALDVLAEEKGITSPKFPKRKDVHFYQQVVSDNGKHRKAFKDAYNFLHLYGYYEGNTRTTVAKTGFSAAKILIDLIKPHPQMPPVIASRRRGNPQKLTLE